MCGILFNYSESDISRESFTAALDSLAHRGPDDSGVETFEEVVIGSRRLAIQDLSPNGHMPMSDASSRYWIVFNGEIYNFKEIKEELGEFNFRSDSDTEVVLYSYIKWGSKCLQKFRGMFAFVVYDVQERKVFFARDRFGQKPLLYYHQPGKELLIASEAKALLKLKPSLAEFDTDQLPYLLSYRYLPSNQTGFKKISSLPPASFVELKLEDNMAINSYWDATVIKTDTNMSLTEAVEKSESLLREAVNYRLIADVPIGVFLSGGLDSSLVTALAAQQYTETLRSFTVVYQEGDKETEAFYARQVAERYKTQHQEVFIDLESLDLVAELEKLFQLLDRPIADPAVFPSYLMSQEVTRNLKVILNGDGGDELFAGYPKVLDLQKIYRYHSFPLKVRQLIHQSIGRLSPRLSFLTEGLVKSPEAAFLYRMGCFHPQIENNYYIDQKSILKSSYWHDPSDYLKQIFSLTEDVFKKSEYFDISSYMPDDTLPKVDFATMGASLEGRSPFLDHRLAEFVFSIPYTLRLKNNQTKFILKKIAEKNLPYEIIYRKKQGFSMPLERWFRQDLHSYLRETLLKKDNFISDYLEMPVVEQLIDDHRAGIDYSNHLWILLILEKWGQRYLHSY